MLQVPEKYLNDIVAKVGTESDLTSVMQAFIQNTDQNLHFIIDKNELNPGKIITSLSEMIKRFDDNFQFQIGQRIVKMKNPNLKYSETAIQLYFCPVQIKSLTPHIKVEGEDVTATLTGLNKYIPITNYPIERVGIILNRISDFEKYFDAHKRTDFFNSEKLLVIADLKIFNSIPISHPACYVNENSNGDLKIKYNSPIQPKITILKNINLVEKYVQQENNGANIKFNTCVFVGSTRFQNSINNIRNYYHQGRFTRAIFIGRNDIKLDLGNNQIPLRWKWTIPEVKYFKGEKNIQHEPVIINNQELEIAIAEFYQTVKEIENKHTVGLKSIYRFIRRLYYDWNLKQETTFAKLRQIQHEFDVALNQLLIETLGNIYPDFDFEEFQKPLSAKFGDILNALKTNNKNEKIKTYQTPIHQLILPSFLCKVNRAELAEIKNRTSHHSTFKSLQELSQLMDNNSEQESTQTGNYHALNSNGEKTEILSLAKSDDSNGKHQKVISSIYGSGKVEKLIERLGKAKSEYKLLLYSIEKKAFKHHVDSYVADLNKEYTSQDRFQISGVAFNDNYYQFSNYDELIDALASTKYEYADTDNYRITFSDRSRMKLPSTKTVLRIHGKAKTTVAVEDLNVDDKVLIYANPDKKLLRDIMELMNPELMKKADEYSQLWRTCLNDAYQNNILAEPLYQQLVENHFSVSEFTFRKYLDGAVMFPRSFSDLVIIAKTINDSRLSFEFLKNTMKPKIEEYRGMEIEFGFKFSNSINHFIITDEADEFISEWLTLKEIESIVEQLPVKTIKDIDLITQNTDD